MFHVQFKPWWVCVNFIGLNWFLALFVADLVPKETVERWIQCLQQEFPVVAFKASTQLRDGVVVGGAFYSPHFKNIIWRLCHSDFATAAGSSVSLIYLVSYFYAGCVAQPQVDLRLRLGLKESIQLWDFAKMIFFPSPNIRTKKRKGDWSHLMFGQILNWWQLQLSALRQAEEVTFSSSTVCLDHRCSLFIFTSCLS